MSSRKRKGITLKDVCRWLRQGFGLGELTKYTPWIRVQDFSSRGTSTKLPLVSVDRTAHLLSRLEYRIALALDFANKCIEFREQYPLLPIAELQDLARAMGIRYPTYPGTKTPVVLTIDFFALINATAKVPPYLAIEAKYNSALRHCPKHPHRLLRTLELMEMKRRWLTSNGVQLFLLTEDSIDKTLFLNLKILNQVAHRRGSICHEDNYNKYLDAIDAVDWKGVPLRELYTETASRLHWPAEDAFIMFKHLVWHHYIEIDLFELLDRNMALSRFCIHEDPKAVLTGDLVPLLMATSK